MIVGLDKILNLRTITKKLTAFRQSGTLKHHMRNGLAKTDLNELLAKRTRKRFLISLLCNFTLFFKKSQEKSVDLIVSSISLHILHMVCYWDMQNNLGLSFPTPLNLLIICIDDTIKSIQIFLTGIKSISCNKRAYLI